MNTNPNKLLVMPLIALAMSCATTTTQVHVESPAETQGTPPVPVSPYMGGPVELGTAPNGAIANQRLLDGIEKVGWVKADRWNEPAFSREAQVWPTRWGRGDEDRERYLN